MDFISPFIEPVTSCLCDPLMKQTSYLFKAKSNIKNMTSSMDELIACRDDLQKEIKDAEREQKQRTNLVELWLKNVGDIKDQVGITKTKYESRGCRLFGDCSLNCWSTYKLGREASKLLVEVDQLKAQRADFHSIATQQPPGHSIAVAVESTLYGLDRYIKMVRDNLKDNDVGVIGIYGMGGVGKTTLLKEINNSLLGENNLGFEYLIWVVVSKEFQLTKVQAQVAENLKLELKNKDDANGNANIIYNYLKDKDFLLMLDDVWEEFKIVDVGIPDTHCGSSSNNQTKRRQKVILTSRSERVCGRMDAGRKIRVECLDKPNARDLFKKTLGEWDLKDNPRIHRLVEEVADECAGLPLALVVIARAMSCRRTIEEWQQAIKSLKKLSQSGKLLDEDLHLFSTLKFSYDSLKSDALRKFFLYCSLWPEDHNIEKDDIIAFCIGIQLIKDFDTITDAFDKGHVLIEDLKVACLLESRLNDRVNMHDVLRDLALWIASDCGVNQNKWLVKAGIGLREVQSEVGKWKEAQAVSLMCNDVEEVPPVPFDCPKVEILMLQWNRELRKIDPSIFQNMCALTSLSLGGTQLDELPESIGMLTMLLYLDLSHTYISSLPKGLGNLTRLRYLDLHFMTDLACIPAGVISNLVELQVFDLRWATEADKISIRGPEADENDGEQSEEISSKKGSLIDEVEQLPGGLKGFGLCLCSVEAFRRLSRLSRVFTWHLQLSGVEDLTTIHLKRNMWSSLESLILDECNEAKELVFAADEGKNNDRCPIKKLRISSLRELREIIIRGVVPSVFFQRLQDVHIQTCDSLKNINWILGLQSLDYLRLDNCSGIECLVDDLPGKEDADEAFFFPTLTRLELFDLPKLCCICRPISRGNFPSVFFPRLQHVKIVECGSLKNINWILGLPLLVDLKLWRCSGIECLVDDLPGKEDADEAFDFPTLTRLTLNHLPKLCCICRPISRGNFPSVVFQRLQRVKIDGCGSLKNINWILGLQSLAYLSLYQCSGIECLVDDIPGKEDADEAFDFPSLRTLVLSDLPKLCCICRPIPRINFPTLESLDVWCCPNLKKFPFPTSNDKLKISCDPEWWDGLEVEESIKNSLEAKVSSY